jgi:hypothetical protein
LSYLEKSESCGLPETGKIYWTEEGKQFDPKILYTLGRIERSVLK